MNNRQRKTFATYWLVEEFHYSILETELMIKYFELYQLDDLADRGMKRLKHE